MEGTVAFDPVSVRNRFPALRRTVAGRPAVYLDGPAGTQVPDSVADAVAAAMRSSASNIGGRFAASEESDGRVGQARQAVADLINAPSVTEIVFGQNMTSLTFAASRALSSRWQEGDEIVLTRLDHDANVRGWLEAAEAKGVTVRFADFDSSGDCRLTAESVADLINPRTRLVAVTRASNALGSVVDVGAIAAAAHSYDALVYVDAVHFAPHGSIDVQDLGCDFLAISAYKFFGPHTGILYGRASLLADLEPLRVRHAPVMPPGRWETGTQSFESLAGVTAAVDYLASLGAGSTRRAALESAAAEVARYERSLSDRFLTGLAEIPGVRLYGPAASEGRVPTFSVDIAGMEPAEAAGALGEAGIFAWSGHNYAIGVMESLDRLDKGGLLRLGFVHYTLAEEVDVALAALDRLAGGHTLADLR